MQVSAPVCTGLTENGRVVYLYKGDVVPKDLKKDSLENLKSLGFVTSDDVDPALETGGDEPKDEPEQKPATRRSSSK